LERQLQELLFLLQVLLQVLPVLLSLHMQLCQEQERALVLKLIPFSNNSPPFY
jgi:hypothetical protein